MNNMTNRHLEQSYYFITGLPRSRTAWLSMMMSEGDSFCFHEGMTPSRKLSDIFPLTRKEYVGDSSCYIPYEIHTLKEEFPNGKFVVIERDFEEVVADMERVFKPHLRKDTDMRGGLEQAKYRLDNLCHSVEHLLVKFNDLDDVKVLKQIWDYCIPTKPFPILHVGKLLNFNIQVTESYINSLVEGK